MPLYVGKHVTDDLLLNRCTTTDHGIYLVIISITINYCYWFPLQIAKYNFSQDKILVPWEGVNLLLGSTVHYPHTWTAFTH